MKLGVKRYFTLYLQGPKSLLAQIWYGDFYIWGNGMNKITPTPSHLPKIRKFPKTFFILMVF